MSDYEIGTPVWVVWGGYHTFGIVTNRKPNGEGEYVYAVVEAETGHIGIYLNNELKEVKNDKHNQQRKVQATTGSHTTKDAK